MAQSASVGTLLVIQNGTPPSHRADIVGLTTSWVQIGDGLSASDETADNPADPSRQRVSSRVYAWRRSRMARPRSRPATVCGRTMVRLSIGKMGIILGQSTQRLRQDGEKARLSLR